MAPPICIAGIGRSGTTIFFRVLASHPELGWVSNVMEKMPGLPQLALLSRLNPLIRQPESPSWAGRFVPRPAESVHSIKECSHGLFSVPREVSEEEISKEVMRSVRNYHKSLLRWQGRPRLITKHTGFPRFRFWRKIYPDARLIRIVRDGRAVVNSLMNVGWWQGTLDTWKWGPIPEKYLEEYEHYGRRRSVLAAIGWKRLMDLYEQETRLLPVGTPLKEVRYTDFTANPWPVMRDAVQFAGLSESSRFARSVRRFHIRDGDTGWQTGLDPEDLALVERVIGDHLSKYGFS